MVSMSPASDVSEREWDVWRTFYAMRRQLDRALENQLQEDSGISAPDYEILVTLFRAPERRMRSRDLAGRLSWEKSRISHQVTRMAGRGLVVRRDCDDDLRGTWIELAPAGSRAVLGSMRQHSAAVRKMFFDVLTHEEQDSLLAISERVLEAINPPRCSDTDTR